MNDKYKIYHYYISPLTVTLVSFTVLFGGIYSYIGIIFLIFSINDLFKKESYERISKNNIHIIYSLLAIIGIILSLFAISWRMWTYYVLGGAEGAIIMYLPIYNMYEGITLINLLGCMLSSIYTIHRSTQTFLQSMKSLDKR